ncbi:hypothetical protein [Flaviaesturariibacter terrae]
MKKLLLLSILASGLAARAQDRPTYVVNPGETIQDKLSFPDLNKYPKFTAGTVFFNNGTVNNNQLNYNYFAGGIQFIDPKGDTLTLGNEDQIGLVTIGTDSFYYNNKVCLQLLERLPEGGGLYRKEFIRVASIRKMGLYDQPVDGAAVDNVSNYLSGVQDKKLTLNQKITLVRETFLYITDKYEHLVLVATRKNFERLYPKRRDDISEYLAGKKVNFQNEADVRGLLAFLQHRS